MGWTRLDTDLSAWDSAAFFLTLLAPGSSDAVTRLAQRHAIRFFAITRRGHRKSAYFGWRCQLAAGRLTGRTRIEVLEP